MVVRFVKIWRFCVAEEKKKGSFGSRKAANLLPRNAGDDNVDLYGGIAALGLANDHFFVSAARQTRQIFTNRTTTFLGKHAKCPSLCQTCHMTISSDLIRRPRRCVWATNLLNFLAPFVPIRMVLLDES